MAVVFHDVFVSMVTVVLVVLATICVAELWIFMLLLAAAAFFATFNL